MHTNISWKYLVKIFLISSLLLTINIAKANTHKAGDLIVRAGITSVQPDESSSVVTLDGSSLGSDSGISVDNNTQLGLTATYMLTNNWGLEVLAATPFKHTVYAQGATLTSLGVNKIADIKHLPPTLSAIYYFDLNNAIQPYLGLGVNYTIFFNENASSDLTSALGKSDVSLDNSWGISPQIGFDYQLNSDWFVNGAARYIDISTDATITTASGVVRVSADIDPMVYTLSIGFKY